MYLKAWKKLPFAKQAQLAKAYGIKWYGTNEAQLEFELSTKLPKGLLVVEPKVEEVKEVEEVVETSVEVKVKEPKKKKKKK